MGIYMRNIFMLLLFCLSGFIYAQGNIDTKIEENNDNELLNEYKLLYTDLENVNTNGYKSYYSYKLNKATPIITAGIEGQGSLQHTNIPTDFAIMGEGFFKIKMDNGKIGYTRNGNFRINLNGELITRDYFSLFEPIIFPDLFLPDTVKINKERDIFVSIPKNGEITELKVGKLNLYMPPIELLEHYNDGIYILKENTDKKIIIDDSEFPNEFNPYKIKQKFLEFSNCYLLPVVLRMYYILSKPNNKFISNIEFKKDLMKSMIDNLVLEVKNYEEYNLRIGLIGAFIPFLRYDY
jgi:flagellar basal body rod protein FlgF